MSLLSENKIAGSFPAGHWGYIDNDEILLFTLHNNCGMTMNVSNYGAVIQSLCVPDRSGKVTDIVLGYDTLESYVNDPYYMGAVVGRYANRIAGGEFFINGKLYKLVQNNGLNSLHGGVSGFNKKVFSAELLPVQHGAAIRFFYHSPDGEEGFPGNLRVWVTYTITNENELIIEYAATTDKDTVINLTQHSYFNLGGNVSFPVLDHHLQTDAGLYLPLNDRQVPTGEMKTVEGTPFDFRIPATLREKMLMPHEQTAMTGGYDHTLVLEKEYTGVLKTAAEVYEPSSGIRMTVKTTEPSLLLYTGNFLESSISGKGGQTFNSRSGFCLETQHFPDSPNHKQFPSTLLRAGETFFSKTVFLFGV